MKQEKAYKIKLIKILEILRQDSDEDHYIESTEILSKLAAIRRGQMGCRSDTIYPNQREVQRVRPYAKGHICSRNKTEE